MLLFTHQLGVFFLFGLATTFDRCTTFAQLAGLGLLLLFDIFAVDLGKNVFDTRVGVCVNKMSEEVS